MPVTPSREGESPPGTENSLMRSQSMEQPVPPSSRPLGARVQEDQPSPVEPSSPSAHAGEPNPPEAAGEPEFRVVGVNWMMEDSPRVSTTRENTPAPPGSPQGSGWAADDDQWTHVPRQGSGWAQDDDEWDSAAATQGSAHTVVDDREVSDGEPPSQSDVSAQADSSGDPAPGDRTRSGEIGPVDPLNDRDVLEFALYQRGCAGRRRTNGRPRVVCSRAEPCEDCRQHDGAYVAASFWETLSLDTLDLRLRSYLDRRPSMPEWRSRRMPNLHFPRFFGPANAPPWPTYYRDTTPDPPVFPGSAREDDLSDSG
ncbi:hypothetical protein AURDEDRAFT_128804 [Auricularia subglabra TFB-10046 SS5]|nr:hypothetical protein AURDEDRAFT_128804 [Auricularia subglabra TFB-10046 SS5]